VPKRKKLKAEIRRLEALRKVEKRIKISLATMGAAGPAKPKDVENPFRLPELPPGVLPKGERQLAQDDAGGYLYGGDAFSSYGLNTYGDVRGFLGFPYLALLSQMPEYRQIYETIAQEMTREWITVFATGEEDKTDKVDQLNLELDRLKVKDAFRRVAELDAIYGRGHLYPDLGKSDDEDELKTLLTMSKAKIRKGSFQRLMVIEPTWTYPAAYNASDPLGKDYYRPMTWYVMARQVHRSRLLTFVGREMVDFLKPAYSFGGLSVIQMAKPYVDHFLRTRESVSDMVHAFSVMVLSTDMGSSLSGADVGTSNDIFNRVDLFNRTRDNRGMMLVDKDMETLTNVSAPLGGLDALLAQAQEQVASIAKVPLVKLLGVTPSGLNASTDGEIRVFYDTIHAYQHHLFGEHLRFVIKLAQMSLWGEIDPDIDFKFNQLWQTNETEQATIRKTNADTAQVYIQAGILAPEEERTRLAEEDEGLWSQIEADKLPPPPEAMGQEPTAPEGGGKKTDEMTPEQSESLADKETL
jgi:phage-related protein (TIGR01555 family)